MTTVYLDFDNTMVESNQRVIEIINQRYGTNKTERDLVDYGYKSIYAISEQEKLDIFESDEFFNNLKFKPQIIDIISRYIHRFNWVISTKGTPKNIEKKKAWIEKYWPFEMEVRGITNDNLSKSSINMTGGIQIDDVSHALDTKADVKILYKDFNNFSWQQTNPEDDILTVNSWEEIGQILDFYSKYNAKTLKKRS